MIEIRRRRLLLASGALLAARNALVQASVSSRVGYLSGGRSSDSVNSFKAFVDGMRALGYREGENLIVDARYANYSEKQAAALAAEIAAHKPAAIVANGGGIAPAYRLSPAIPLVLVHSGDPVEAGFADSYARPGRHATGISLMALDLIPKRLELLREFRPNMRRVAFLASPEHAGQKRELAASRAAADMLGVEVSYHEVRTPGELQAALPRVAAEKPDGALLFSDALMIGQRQMLADFFLQHRIPSAAGWSVFPDTGHLLSYGPERLAVWRRLSQFVDKIIKGAPPASLPIELPSVFELVVNLRTAKAMKLTVPKSILARAERTVE